MRDPYQVLGVPSTATDEEVKKAYRDLARKYHPDNYHDNPLADLAQERMKEINEAYEAVQSQRKAQRSGGYSASGAGYGTGYGGPAVHNAGEELHPVRLHAGGGQAVAPCPALVHAGGEERLIHRHPRRHAVQHSADGTAMALAEDGQGEGRPERVLHGHSSMPSRGRRPSTGMVSARQQPRPGTLMMVI